MSRRAQLAYPCISIFSDTNSIGDFARELARYAYCDHWPEFEQKLMVHNDKPVLQIKRKDLVVLVFGKFDTESKLIALYAKFEKTKKGEGCLVCNLEAVGRIKDWLFVA